MRSYDLQEAHPLEPLWEGWARAMRVRGLAPGTITSRRGQWRSWMDYVGEGWAAAEYTDVEEWLDGRRLGPSAKCRAVSDLASFYKWARRQGFAHANPTELVDRPRIPRRLPRPADEPGIARALAVGRVEDRRAVALMYYAGLRCCEVSRLTAAGVDLVEGWLDVIGKGNVERRLPIFPPLEPYLAALAGEPPSTPVYLTLRGDPARPARVSALVNDHLRASGCRFTCHQLRHRFGTRMLAQTANLRLVQTLLGHANVATTQIYTLVDLEDFAGLHTLWGN